MRVMVTGANGFIGRVLVNRLLANGTLRGRPIEALLLLDPLLEGFGGDKRLRSHIASTTEPAVHWRMALMWSFIWRAYPALTVKRSTNAVIRPICSAAWSSCSSCAISQGRRS